MSIFRKTIALDAGHGPNTPGKRSPDGALREYTFNRAVADEVQKLLLLYKCAVVRTDSPALDVPLADRCRTAVAAKSTILVSIHANASGNDWSAASGIETLIRDAVGTPHYSASMDLALAVHKRLIASTGLRDRSIKQRSDLYILNASKRPTILVEAGFMTNRQECKLLLSPTYRSLVARAVCDGIVEACKLSKR